MFIAYNKVRMHDTDMAGILYFARQFRFVHDALEDLMESEGIPFDHLFHKSDFVFVIVHAEADYYAPLRVGDKLEVHVTAERIGTTSFTMNYHIYKLDRTLIGSAKTVHVSLEFRSRAKVPLNQEFREKLSKYLISNDVNL